jgi:hypothetical protein
MRFQLKPQPHRSDWVRWFAVLPVRIGNQLVWMEYVERREQFHPGYIHYGIWLAEYRLLKE